jgi:putative ABC transport system ATP-binding protein
MASALLRIERMVKDYYLGDGRVPVLQGLDLSVAAGEMVVIMGPSGSGKTTLLNCMSGIDIPDAGNVIIRDIPVDLTSEHQRTLLRRHQIGIVFQFFNLIPTLNVRENIALPFLIAKQNPPQQQRKVDDFLALTGLQKRAAHYPFQLSGGEMQLVSIARALIHEPAILLADEPTGNVNPNVGRHIMDILRNTAKQKNTAVIMVTHSPEHAAWADRVCFIKEGVIAGEHRNSGAVAGAGADVAQIYAKLLELGI